MARRLTLVAAFAASGAFAVQRRADAPQVTAEVLAGPNELWRELDSNAIGLKKMLQGKKSHQTSAREYKTSANAAVLKRQLGANEQLELANAHASKKIDKMQAENAHIRREARWLQEENDGLVVDIMTMGENITTASDFVGSALAESDRLLGTSKTEVLAILAKEDEATFARDRQEARMDEINAADYSGIGLFQIHAGIEEDPQKTIQALLAGMDKIAEYEAADDARFQEYFEASYTKGLQRNKALSEEELRLEALAASARHIRQRLDLAFEFLQSAHTKLLGQSQGVRAFAENLGKSHVQKPADKSVPKALAEQAETLAKALSPKNAAAHARELVDRATNALTRLEVKAKQEGTATKAAAKSARETLAQAKSLLASVSGSGTRHEATAHAAAMAPDAAQELYEVRAADRLSSKVMYKPPVAASTSAADVAGVVTKAPAAANASVVVAAQAPAVTTELVVARVAPTVAEAQKVIRLHRTHLLLERLKAIADKAALKAKVFKTPEAEAAAEDTASTLARAMFVAGTGGNA